MTAASDAATGDAPRSVADTLPQDGAPYQQALDLSAAGEAPPSSAPGYHVLRRIGAGHYGSVWLARELNTGKHVAIKFYSRRRGVDWSLLGREVEKLAVLYTSRQIVGLLAVGWDHDPPYYVMEYLENGSLEQRLAAGPLPAAEAVRIATRVAQGLVHAHGSGILHCDLKPANVLLDQDWEPRLCDFGQSRLADERSPSLGTLFYMAPEQADLKAVPDARWDVYALGALLYHMLCGQPPHRQEEHLRQLRLAGDLDERLACYQRLVRGAPRPVAHRRVAGVDAGLVDIVDRCLTVDPARRLPNAQAVLDRLAARERLRARRPLIVMGLILPLLVVLSVLPFALGALRDAVTTSRSNIVRRALESDVLSAHLLAVNLNRELEDRLQELVAIAEDEDVRAAILAHLDQPRDQRRPLYEMLASRKARIDRRRWQLGRSIDASWFLQDARGYQRWREPGSETVDRRFACRDYFHGRGVDYDERSCPADLPPIAAPHISVPYRSTSSSKWVLALSTPVFSAAESEQAPRQVVAVLARTLNLTDLLDDYEPSLAAQGPHSVGRVASLVDSKRWNLLAHPWMTDEHLRRLDDPVTDLQLPESLGERLRPLLLRERRADDAERSDLLSDYVDPVSRWAPEEFGGPWLAAFAPVGQTGWIAIVQERRQPVFAPIEELRDRLIWTAVLGVSIVCVLAAGCWWLIIVLLNERSPRWLQRWKRGASAAAPSLSGKASEGA